MSLDLQLLALEVQQAHARALYSHTRVLSGAYKRDVVHCGSHNGPLADEQQLLDRELQTMQAHIHRAEDLIEAYKGELSRERQS